MKTTLILGEIVAITLYTELEGMMPIGVGNKS